MKTERSALWLSAAAALGIGCIGVIFSQITGSRAILLDGLFNLVYLVTALLTIRVSKLVRLPDTDEYPLGYIYLEPVMNGVKGVMIFGLSILALFDAVYALFHGGRVIAAGAAIGYGVFATLACLATAFFLRRAYRKTNSPLVGVDAASWSVNGAISAAVLITFGAIPFIEASGWASVVPFVDPFLVSVVVLISLVVPIRMAWQAALALVNRAPVAAERDPVVATIRKSLSDLPSRSVTVRMVKPGRSLHIAVYVVLPIDFPVTGLATLDDVRARVQEAVQQGHGTATVDVLFTGDERWAVPNTAFTPDAAKTE